MRVDDLLGLSVLSIRPSAQTIRLIQTYRSRNQTDSGQNDVTALDLRRTENVFYPDAECYQAKNANEQHQCEPCPIVSGVEIKVAPSSRAAPPV